MEGAAKVWQALTGGGGGGAGLGAAAAPQGSPGTSGSSPPSVPQGSPPSVLGTAAMAEEPSALPWSINKDDYELQEVIGEDFGPNFGGG